METDTRAGPGAFVTVRSRAGPGSAPVVARAITCVANGQQR